MPSLLHEALSRLIHDKREFAAYLLRQLLNVEMPHFTEARLDDTSLNEAVPIEYRADAVILFENGSSAFGSVFEPSSARIRKKTVHVTGICDRALSRGSSGAILRFRRDGPRRRSKKGFLKSKNPQRRSRQVGAVEPEQVEREVREARSRSSPPRLD
jgi:hypothetical protein